MHFNDEFIASVEDNPVEGIIKICNLTLQQIDDLATGNDWNDAEHKLLWEAASFIDIIIELNNLLVPCALPESSADITKNCTELTDYLSTILTEFKHHSIKMKIKTYKSRYKSALRASFAYEFSQGDLDRVQILINELRDHITENKALQNEHKRRLLKRLEQLQSELHKRVSDLDKFWGLIGDAGVVLGKLGNDAKPIVDRIREIATITWQIQIRAEELPSNAPRPLLEEEKQSNE